MKDKKKLRKERPWSALASMLLEDAKIASKYGEENLGRRYNTFRCVIDRENKEEPIHCTGLAPDEQDPEEYYAWMRAEWARRTWQSHALKRPTREQYMKLASSTSLRRLLSSGRLPDDEDEDED